MPHRTLDEHLKQWQKQATENQPQLQNQQKQGEVKYKIIGFYKETQFQETPIGKIPREWKLVKLSEITEKIKAGGTPRVSVKEYWNGNIPFAKIEDLTSKYVYSTSTTISELGLKNSNAWIIPERSLLLAMYGSVGEVAINMIKLATNQAILGIIPKKHMVDVEYLYYWFLYFKPKWRIFVKHTTQPNLTAEIVRNSYIPLPPLEEQWGIAEVLSSIDQTIEAVDRLIQKLESVKKALMQELLTKGIGHKEFKETPVGKIPNGWKLVKLGLVVGKVKGRKPEDICEDVAHECLPYLEAQVLRGIEAPKYVKPRNGVVVEPGDIVMIWDGSYAGEVFLIKERGILASTMVKLVPKSNELDMRYLYYWLLHKGEPLRKQRKGTGIPHVSEQVFSNLPIALPPLEEQMRIADMLKSVDDWIELEMKRKEKLESLKRGLMDLLLSGVVRVKVSTLSSST